MQVEAMPGILELAAYSHIKSAGLHVKPLSPLLSSGETQPDTGFMRTFTNPAYFAVETALLAMVALCSPIR